MEFEDCESLFPPPSSRGGPCRKVSSAPPPLFPEPRDVGYARQRVLASKAGEPAGGLTRRKCDLAPLLSCLEVGGSPSALFATVVGFGDPCAFSPLFSWVATIHFVFLFPYSRYLNFACGGQAVGRVLVSPPSFFSTIGNRKVQSTGGAGSCAPLTHTVFRPPGLRGR